MLNGGVGGEVGGILSEIPSLDIVSLRFQPVEISGELSEFGIDLDAAQTCWTTHGFVVDGYFRHGDVHFVVKMLIETSIVDQRWY